MGTSKSAAEFAGKIHGLATATQQASREVVDNAALAGKEIILATAKSRGVSKDSMIAGGKWGVKYNTKGKYNPTSLLQVYGSFHLVENDTKPHMIYRRGQRARGRGSRRINRQAIFNEVFGGVGAYTGGALQFNGSVYRKVVNHPGTKGKHIFRDSKKKIHRAVPVIMKQRLIPTWKSVLNPNSPFAGHRK